MSSVRLTNIPTESFAQNGSAHTQRTVSSTSVAVINHTLQPDTTHVLVQFNGADCRVTFDGTTAATAARGFLYADGTSDIWPRLWALDARGIRGASTDVVVEIQELNLR
jgi:hypothetical protein